MAKAKYLRDPSTNRVFGYTEGLAKTGRLFPYNGPIELRNGHAVADYKGLHDEGKANPMTTEEELSYKARIKKLEDQLKDYEAGAERPALPEDLTKPERAGEIVDATTGAKEEQGNDQNQPPDDPNRIALIVEAMKEVDYANEDFLMKETGAPKVEVLEDLLGMDMTSAERDEAWEEFQKTPKE